MRGVCLSFSLLAKNNCKTPIWLHHSCEGVESKCVCLYIYVHMCVCERRLRKCGAGFVRVALPRKRA